ncbi:hypothetical protein ASPCAL04078 [Aspergillus calidoustus]|uniref:Uncharacterized protein n=1 Tax=Aspergillus calidoustus TaxID=454130 RepID=A0A0U4YZZ2_ASPCI|nr:hypothetical protein ASPCAL04078 [Aspergillus calidoustus]
MASETLKVFTRVQNTLNELRLAFDACPRSLLDQYNRNHLANHAFRWDRVKRDVIIVAGYFDGDMSEGSLRFLHKFMEDVESYARQCIERTARFTGAGAEGRVTDEDILFVGDCGHAIQATLKSLETLVSVYRDRDEMKSRIGYKLSIRP